jgi:DNA-binding winged helix-turn-helix (wHTH) protein
LEKQTLNQDPRPKTKDRNAKVSNDPARSPLLRIWPVSIERNRTALQRGNELVPLTPKVFDTLLVLVENTGHIVEKE